MWCQPNENRAAVVQITHALNQPLALHPIDTIRDGTRRYHRRLEERARHQFVRLTRTAKRGQHIELPLLQTMLGKKLFVLALKYPLQAHKSPKHTHRLDIDIGTLTTPLLDNRINRIGHNFLPPAIISMLKY